MPNKFVAVRVIVVDPDNNQAQFENFMKTDAGNGTGKGFLEQMVDVFEKEEMQSLMFLKGNKTGRQSRNGAGPNRASSTAAGANADFAWITCWPDKNANQKAWKNPANARPAGWDDDLVAGTTGLWHEFMGWCQPRGQGNGPGEPKRPVHGPPFDFRGVPVGGPQPNPGPFGGAPITHYGRGAGCLVEGFEVIWEWPNPVAMP